MRVLALVVFLIALGACGKRPREKTHQDVILTENVEVIFTDRNNKFVASEEMDKLTNKILDYKGLLFERKAEIKMGYLKGEVSVSTILNRVYPSDKHVFIYKEQL